MRPNLSRLTVGVAALLALSAGPTPFPRPTPIQVKGLHNVFRITERLYSGSSPDDDTGFRSLRALGIQTVLTVDGARPDLERARKYGLRYVHLPIGYDGITQTQAERLARAVRDLPGPIYLHCHHGKHRGPAAAAVAVYCLDARCQVADAVAILRQAGTDPHYRGLYRAPAQIVRPTPADLDRVPADFPATARLPALAQAMVAVDAHWDHLGAIRAAGWNVPSGQADLDPAHEALQLAEQLRESARRPAVLRRPAELRRWLADGADTALALATALRQRPVAANAAQAAYARVAASCTRCHAKYRDAMPP